MRGKLGVQLQNPEEILGLKIDSGTNVEMAAELGDSHRKATERTSEDSTWGPAPQWRKAELSIQAGGREPEGAKEVSEMSLLSPRCKIWGFKATPQSEKQKLELQAGKQGRLRLLPSPPWNAFVLRLSSNTCPDQCGTLHPSWFSTALPSPLASSPPLQAVWSYWAAHPKPSTAEPLANVTFTRLSAARCDWTLAHLWVL